MTTSFNFWEEKHRKYVMKDCVIEPNYLTRDVVDALADNCRILDLGCGQGQDAVYLATKGHRVTAADFSPFALAQFPDSARELGVDMVLLDIREIPYPFTAGYFDVVYAHLSLHYFSEEQTRQIFEEIGRILRPNGWLFALFNSIRDPECGTGVQIERHYWEISPGERKRFFSVEEMPSLLGENLTIHRSEYGTGTRKNVNDQFVLLVAAATATGMPDCSG